MKAEIQRALNSLYHSDNIDVELLNQVISYIEKLENHIRYETIPIRFIEHEIEIFDDFRDEVAPLKGLLRDYMEIGRDDYEDISAEL